MCLFVYRFVLCFGQKASLSNSRIDLRMQIAALTADLSGEKCPSSGQSVFCEQFSAVKLRSFAGFCGINQLFLFIIETIAVL